MRREAWPGALAAVAWAWFLVTASVAHAAGGLVGVVAVLLAAGPSLAVSAWSAARSEGPGRRSVLRPAAGVVAALLLGAYGGELVTEAASTMVRVGLEEPVVVHPVLPGASEAWTYAVALGLTAFGVGSSRRAALVAGGAAALGAVLGGGLLVAQTASAVPTLSDDTAGSCRGPFTVLSAGIHSLATGDLGGASLGSVELRKVYEPDVPPGVVLVVRYDTRWGAGEARLPAPTRTERDPLGVVTLRRELLVPADDLGIDLVGGRAARHCRIHVDGPTAVAGFPALRWLVGEDEGTIERAAGLELWRGTVDYWLVATPAARFVEVGVILATVAVDGQPPAWPFPGLHASLRAASWYGEPSPGPRVTE